MTSINATEKDRKQIKRISRFDEKQESKFFNKNKCLSFEFFLMKYSLKLRD